MDNLYLNYFLSRKKCLHEKMTHRSAGNFCPDCGKRIETHWKIIRCECCSVKREAYFAMNSIRPIEKHCVKCGETKFIVEKKETLDLNDIFFALLVKEEVKENKKFNSFTQIWVDEDNKWDKFIQPKLIPSLPI